jgi:Zn-dependent peptidase ImmA (M78 family)
MDYKKIFIPFLDNSSIKKSADSFRDNYWDDTIPVDIERIINVKMEIDIIPSPGLHNLCDVDALIYSNWKSIIVDYNKYSDERYQNRLRFSYAHEIGHFILHKNIHKNLKIKSTKDFQKFIKEVPQIQYGYLETQANKFANFLLIPRGRLSVEKEKEMKKNKELGGLISSGKLNKKTVNSYLAIPLSKTFGVSEEAMEIALNETDGI